MCSGAILWAKIKRVVYGTPQKQLAGILPGAPVKIDLGRMITRLNPDLSWIGPVQAEKGIAFQVAFWTGHVCEFRS